MAIVKLLDAKSADYQICAKRWVVQVEAAQDSEAEKAYMLRRLESGLAITPDGRACPALLAKHKDQLEAALTK